MCALCFFISSPLCGAPLNYKREEHFIFASSVFFLEIKTVSYINLSFVFCNFVVNSENILHAIDYELLYKRERPPD